MLDYQAVTELVHGLDNDFATLRDDAIRRYDLYAMRREPYVPDEIAREGAFQIKSPMLIDAAKAIRSDIMMNPIEFTVLPLARQRDRTIGTGAEKKAENMERALAVLWTRLNHGLHLDYDCIMHQLISPFAVWVLNFNSYSAPEQPEWMDDEAYVDMIEQYEADWIPWSVTAVDPLTCSWVERNGTPTMFARRYKMQVRDIERNYAKRHGSMYPDKFLRLGDDGAWGWSDDYHRDTTNYREGFQEVEMLWLDDGEYIYHVAMSPGTNTPLETDGEIVAGGELLWRQPNPTGRVTAFIIPGNITPFRRPEDRYEPFLLPLMQIVMHLNDLRSTRATAARNLAGPHTYIAVDPEIAKEYIKKGEPLPTAVRWRKNETHYLLGKMEQAPSELSTDWDKLEQDLNQELQRYLPSPFVHIVDPAVIKAATATSILHAAETGLRIYGPLMKAKDIATHDIMMSIIQSIRTSYSDVDMYLHSDGEERVRGKNVTRGSVYRLNATAVSFPFRLLVKTRGMSQAQAAAQFDLILKQWMLPDGSHGPASFDDVIDAGNYTDRDGQKMKIAKELMLNTLDPFLQQQAMQVAAQRIKLDSGIDLPMGQPPQSQPTPARLPSGAQRMDAPQVTAPEGGNMPEQVTGG